MAIIDELGADNDVFACLEGKTRSLENVAFRYMVITTIVMKRTLRVE